MGGLARYVTGASLARTADAGAVVGLVLLATTGPAGAGAGGLLAAAVTAPHLAGPLLARRLDRARDARPLLASACAAYAVALAGAALLVGRAPLAVPVLVLVLAGLCGPVLTGGLSSRLPSVVPAGRPLARAQGLDAVSYGVAGTVGPALVALVAAAASPLAALLLVAAAAGAAAGLILTLPASPADRDGAPPAPRLRQVIRLVAGRGLRRSAVSSTVASTVAGASTVLAVGLALQLGRPATAGAVLAAGYGLGNLAGALLATAVPVRGDPDAAAVLLAALAAVTFAASGAAPTYAVAVLAFVAGGVVNGPFFAATLAARTRYAPPEGRAQVFVTMSAAKVAAWAAGAAGAGALGLGRARAGLVGGGLLLGVVVAVLAVDRRAHPPDRGA